MRAAQHWALFEKAWAACLGVPVPPFENTLIRCSTCLRTSRANEVILLESPAAPRGLAWVVCAHHWTCDSQPERRGLTFEYRSWTFEDEIQARMLPGGAYERDERERRKRQQERQGQPE